MSEAHRLVAAIAAAFREAKLVDLMSLYAVDAVLHHPLVPEPLHGHAMIAGVEDGLFTSYSEHEWVAEQAVGDDRNVAIRYLLRARNTGPMPMPDGGMVPATHRQVEFRGASFFRLDEGGLIAEEHRFVGSDSLRTQLGFEPM